MDDSRVRAIKEQIESQRARWNEMMAGGAKSFVGTLTGLPIFCPHVTEEDLAELLEFVEENRKLRAELGKTWEVKIYGQREQDR